MNQDNLPDIAYNFLVGGDGNVYEGRGWYTKPQKFLTDPKCSDKTIDIAFIGKYGYPDVEYPWALHDKATELLLEGQDRHIVVLNLLLLYPKEADD
ncbi:peptidoglycan-recognition protein SC1a/b-like [Macrosteles quadrilineatus]|uniref:peptidoglycan-recognition protein SC1a/b-like n=1 Tax=Macrosteles quadrilineatus TaxID=74068 RepID=UPI0023E3403D|nr:peptidoglycan-recognition protein SC1a/b-like [Macrosteles quadrilineatus]